MVKGDSVQAYRNFYVVAKKRDCNLERKTNTMVHHYDPEPERYYDWMLWKLRQEKMKEQDDPLWMILLKVVS